MRWADGMGGLDIGALSGYFEPGNPGSRLEPEEQVRVRRLVPELISEDRDIQRRQAEQRRKSKQ